MPPLAPTIGGRKEKMRAAGKEGNGRLERSRKGKRPERENSR
jgi:hypothetical protein